MYSKVSFATFDPLVRDVPQFCDLCIASAPVFAYEFATSDENDETRFLKGFCCAPCAPDLVKKLADIESRAWAEEEAALEASELVTP
ncbi:MAG: hypothetical protein DMG68_17225 [Acidobacteria bacterium]|jgi:hypothetical protein|nr:MAG: hypothetical protein DMG68_17225 [Acidobacteriota bacterium]